MEGGWLLVPGVALKRAFDSDSELACLFHPRSRI